MELNEPFEGHEHATTSLKVVLLVFALVLVGALAYLIQATYSQTEETAEVAPSVKDKTEAVTDNTVECGDKAYTYELTLSDDWKGYKVKEVTPTYALVTCYFEMPTTSAETTWTAASTDHSAGYASIFAVSVYTPAQWTAAQEETNKPTKLGETAEYVWGYSPAQALPDDLQASKIADEVKNVVATFKIGA
jgi:hypothetical protein